MKPLSGPRKMIWQQTDSAKVRDLVFQMDHTAYNLIVVTLDSPWLREKAKVHHTRRWDWHMLASRRSILVKLKNRCHWQRIRDDASFPCTVQEVSVDEAFSSAIMRPTAWQYMYSRSERYSLSSANHSRGKTMQKFSVQIYLEPTSAISRSQLLLYIYMPLETSKRGI